MWFFWQTCHTFFSLGLPELERFAMSDFTLEDLDNAVEQQFAPFRFTAEGEEFVLRNPSRLGDTDRKAVLENIRKLESLQANEDNDEPVDFNFVLGAIQALLKTVTEDKKGSRLVKVLGDDLARNRLLFEKYMEQIQGEKA
ncbi:phage tail assembly protein [Actinopolyspora erythraea]|uniref:phage tail assembly protein n=1 Tax=Actinopolyspora erythraea TaxID=414996 RepID=UPI001186FDE3|nr:phage tail assembly protein [Actinopolyspora erythraea]